MPPLRNRQDKRAAESPPLWSFSLAGGWRRAPDPVLAAWPSGTTLVGRQELAEVKARAGFHHLATFGGEDGDLAFVIDQGEAGRFLVEVIFAGDIYSILAEDLPSLLQLLRGLLPLVEIVERLQEAEDRRIDWRRRERTAGDRQKGR
jgi:hypothetical protein